MLPTWTQPASTPEEPRIVDENHQPDAAVYRQASPRPGTAQASAGALITLITLAAAPLACPAAPHIETDTELATTGYYQLRWTAATADVQVEVSEPDGDGAAIIYTGFEEVVIISDEPSPFADGQRQELEKAGLRFRLTADMDAELPALDVVYINTIAWVGEDYQELGSRYRLNASSPLKPGAAILHPLARGKELDRELDATAHNWYFAQARGAVFVRMALLSTILKTFA